MIRRIELSNFMSHKHTVLEPAPGLTVLVGPNNCGKSAVVTALRIVCHNESSQFAVRHGEKEAVVRIETDDGHVVEWSRKNAAKYLIDGQQYDRLGQAGIPDVLHQILKLADVPVNDKDDVNLHFGEQKSPIFLLDRSASHAAAFFASSSDVSHLVEMQALHKRRVTEKKDLKKQLEARSKVLNSELEKLQPLNEVDRQLAEVEARYADLERAASRISQVEKHLAAWSAQVRQAERHQRQAAVLAQVQSPPVLTPTAPLEKLVQDLQAAQQTVARLEARGQALMPLRTPPQLDNALQLERLLSRLTNGERDVARHGRQQQALVSLKTVPELGRTDELQRVVRSLQVVQAQVSRAERQQAASTGLAPLPDVGNVAPLEALVSRLQQAERDVARYEHARQELAQLAEMPGEDDLRPFADLLRSIGMATIALAKCESELAASEAGIQAVESDLKAWAAANPTCPTCGGAVTLESLVAHVAVHQGGPGGHSHA